MVIRPFGHRIIVYTVWMKIMTIFSGELHLLRHYESDFAHLLEFQNLVIEF